MSDLVTCAECGTRYDAGPAGSAAFCPRCGSTARGAVLPAAVAVAQRHDPGRRRVQASGALLLLVGTLFLLSSLIGLAAPVGELARQFREPMADQPGGTLVLHGDGAPFDAVVSTWHGEELANVTGQVEPLEVASPDHATLVVQARSGGEPRNATAIVMPGDRLRLDVGGLDGGVEVGRTLQTTVQVGRIVFIAVAAILLAGGLCALLLRFWPVAVVAALLGALLGLLVLAAFLVYGLLFVVPFGFAAYFILRGRRYFRTG